MPWCTVHFSLLLGTCAPVSSLPPSMPPLQHWLQAHQTLTLSQHRSTFKLLDLCTHCSFCLRYLFSSADGTSTPPSNPSSRCFCRRQVPSGCPLLPVIPEHHTVLPLLVGRGPSGLTRGLLGNSKTHCAKESGHQPGDGSLCA